MSARVLLREDGSVVIPPGRAVRAVLVLLDRDARTASVRDGGGRLSADVLDVMQALALSDAGTWPVPPGRELVSVTDYAARRGVAASYVRRLCRAGLLPAQRIGFAWAVLAQVDKEEEASHGLSDVRATAAAG